MRRFFSRLSLPLLAKELTEKAARKRTYGMRVLFAVLLMAAFGITAKEYFASSGVGSLSVLGRGHSIFRGLIVLQLVGIYLFLPAMASGQITIEKERDSLALLFLTRLGPWHILIEKFLSSLVPVFSLLLVAMPMEAIAYAYGGVTKANIVISIYMLMLIALQVAALALVCSAWCRTTAGAFLSTYLLGTFIYLFAPLSQSLFVLITHRSIPPAIRRLTEWAFYVFPPGLGTFGYSEMGMSEVLKSTSPAWGSLVVLLGLARFFLVRRAFVKGTNPVLAFFRMTDRLMQWLNRFAGNISMGKERDDLPGNYPVAWREMRKNVFARPQYLMRILLMVEVPTIVFGYLIPHHIRTENLSLSSALLGTLAVLIISVNAANAFVSERVQQTLDLLLTTPMSARQIVEEKARAMRRFLYVAAAPLMTLFLIEWNMKSSIFRGAWPLGSGSALYLICSILTLAIYLPLVSWLSLWIGLKETTRFRAIITALVVIVLWCAGPIVAALVIDSNRLEPWIMGMSPIFLPVLNEVSEIPRLSQGHPWLLVTLNFTFYGAMLALIRWRCLNLADYYLRRT
ncbi:MAG: gliding motility-associated transporter permease protein [Chthoniobacteraceae bacterium]|nr:gliding motility-associated transporter permease protein [Chthoniobacteraceae bacterium]